MKLLMALLFAVRLPTGVSLDPAAPTKPVGDMPLAIAVAPGGGRAVLLLCGWYQQGIQVIDTATGEVLQTLAQPAAFVGLAFAPDGKTLYASGGNEDAVYRYKWDGTATADGRIMLSRTPGTRYPAGMAFSPDGKRLYVAENLSDTLAVIDVATGEVIRRMETDRYPYAVAVARNGDVYVSAWGDDVVDRFRNGARSRIHRIGTVRHPSAMLLSGTQLYVASASTDRVAAIDTNFEKTVRIFDDRVPGAREGATPNALAIAGNRLYVAEADANAVAVFDVGRPEGRPHSGNGPSAPSVGAGFSRPKLLGRIPTDWYPSALAVANGKLIVVSAKGRGTAPNPKRPQPGKKLPPGFPDHVLGQLRGSVMIVEPAVSASLTKRVAEANGWNAKRLEPKYPPFRHVLYVIKENRSYDQVLGDMPAGDGDPSLVYFPREVSPNHHALADRFGLFDRFFVNAEVSAQGHNWSTAAYTTDYVEKTMPSNYSDRGRTYDYEGTNREMIVDDEDDVAAPAAGYLWDAAERAGITFRDYGEFVVDDHKQLVATRRALVGHTNLDYPPFDMSIRDQKRADVWLADFHGFVEKGEMPALQIIRLPNDHTSGAAADKPTPRACMADNDLALGRIVEALTHSPFWKDSVMFVLEDDAQNGPDHVDSHRSPLFVVSPYNRPGTIHRFANTTDVLATIEEILKLEPMSQFDRYGRPLRDVFVTEADLTPFDVLRPSVSLDEKNPPATHGAKQSEKLDLRRPDAADEDLFNRILWSMMKGDAPYPQPRRMATPIGR